MLLEGTLFSKMLPVYIADKMLPSPKVLYSEGGNIKVNEKQDFVRLTINIYDLLEY